MPIRTGRLNRRITLQQPVTAQNSYGEKVVTWEGVCTVWAGVEAIRGEEFFTARQHGAETSHKIVIRNPGFAVPATWRAVAGETVYEIEAVIPQTAGDVVELMCKVVV